jgi:hypothetical protein
MPTSSDHKQAKEKLTIRRDGDESLLPLAVRQRLWDQVWAQLLAPPVEAGDRAPMPKRGTRGEGGTR